jgi:hypothetical protein
MRQLKTLIREFWAVGLGIYEHWQRDLTRLCNLAHSKLFSSSMESFAQLKLGQWQPFHAETWCIENLQHLQQIAYCLELEPPLQCSQSSDPWNLNVDPTSTINSMKNQSLNIIRGRTHILSSIFLQICLTAKSIKLLINKEGLRLPAARLVLRVSNMIKEQVKDTDLQISTSDGIYLLNCFKNLWWMSTAGCWR